MASDVGYAPLAEQDPINTLKSGQPAGNNAPVLTPAEGPSAPARVHRGWKCAFYVLLVAFLAFASFVAHVHHEHGMRHREWHAKHGLWPDHGHHGHHGHHDPARHECWHRCAAECEAPEEPSSEGEEPGSGSPVRRLLRTLTRRQRERMIANGHKPKAHSKYVSGKAKGFKGKGK